MKSSSLSIAADTRRIVPARRLLKPDGSLDDTDRTEIGPTPLAFAEWSQLGLEVPQRQPCASTACSVSRTNWSPATSPASCYSTP